ncbi:hypothetical protein JOQ06_003978 [Pogonophryne albipinna]|uniref:Uncharacterized protein n=1 Tax=Pogonophryne albipinna TaxID=1090488 RepID=A0AAD6A5M4_9TELE|nr:hypothetical protein JOQ06_003978 [Pogonophryne albipinna]
MEEVMPEPLPLTPEPGPLKRKQPRPQKRKQPPPPLAPDPEEEGQRRVRNQNLVAVLGEEDESVRLLEDLLFGGEEQLLDHLLQGTYLRPTAALQVRRGCHSSPVELCHQTFFRLLDVKSSKVDKQQTSVSLDDGDDVSGDSEEEGRAKPAKKREAVWIDEDDEREEQ